MIFVSSSPTCAPVDSQTYSAPLSPHLIAAGS